MRAEAFESNIRVEADRLGASCKRWDTWVCDGDPKL